MTATETTTRPAFEYNTNFPLNTFFREDASSKDGIRFAYDKDFISLEVSKGNEIKRTKVLQAARFASLNDYRGIGLTGTERLLKILKWDLSRLNGTWKHSVTGVTGKLRFRQNATGMSDREAERAYWKLLNITISEVERRLTALRSEVTSPERQQLMADLQKSDEQRAAELAAQPVAEVKPKAKRITKAMLLAAYNDLASKVGAPTF